METKKSLEERMKRVEDMLEVQNLMGRYEYMHTAGMHEKVLDLYAMKTPDVSMEIAHWGKWEGPEAVRKGMIGVHTQAEHVQYGVMAVHALASPVIEVAEDGKTARGVWVSPGFESIPEPNGEIGATWCWCKYGCDFIKEDGKWKIWHSHVYRIFDTPYNQSWVETSRPGAKRAMVDTDWVPKELRGNKPTTYDHPYSVSTAPEYVPAPPEPYKTFNPKNRY
jgi:hypothetical protein